MSKMDGTRPSHRIRRVALEFQFPKSIHQSDFQKRLSKLFWQKIKPIIDEVCDELSPPGQIDRIKKIELDLGRIPLDKLEDINQARLKELLREKLKEQIRPLISQPLLEEAQTELQPAFQSTAHSENPGTTILERRVAAPIIPGQNSLETINHFMETGVLPWWEDLSQYRSLDDCFTKAVTSNQLEAGRFFRNWLKYPGLIKRLVSQFQDESLIRLAETLYPGINVGERLRKALSKAEVRSERSGNTRMEWWAKVFDVMGRGPNKSQAHDVWLRILEINDEVTEQVLDFEQDVSLGMPKPKEDAPRLESMIQGSEAEDLVDSIDKPQKSPATDVPHHLRGVKHGSKEDGLEPAIKKDEESNTPEVIASKDDSVPESEATPRQHHPGKDELKIQQQSEVSKDQDFRPDRPHTPLLRLRPEDSIYVMNSGLVIFWPFLSRLFEKAKLVEKNTFNSTEAQHRAAYLLHGLTTGQPSAPEYQLPLNKLLCGIPVNFPVMDLPPLIEEELALCEQLITAVVEQAPVLNNMSVDGMRGNFLIRDGALKLKNHQWTLHAKRETFDVVLDRFPWPFNFVKLPWMESMLYVEW